MMVILHKTVNTSPPANRESQAPEVIGHLLTEFDSISLPEMNHVALLNRIDTKYIMRVSQLYQVLERIADNYRVLETANTRLHHYQTLYFDTPGFALYQQHHNGLRSRYKVRVREYLDSNRMYWEVKRKTNQNRTVKSRMKTRSFNDERVDDFLEAHTPVGAQELVPVLCNRFIRLTLVSKHRPVRLTLDFGLEFECEDASAGLPGIAIAELKQTRTTQPSDFTREMHRLGIRPMRFSKYCAGIYMLYPGVKINNFKDRIRLVEKLMQEEASDERIH